MPSLFIFRRDLRLDDNTGLLAALGTSESVMPCFILDPVQVNPHPYRSEFAFQFMVGSLLDLDARLRELGSRLHIFEGAPAEVVDKLVLRGTITSVHVNRDYTPYARERDDAIRMVCKQRGIAFVSHRDALLFEPEDIGRLYRVYSAFRRATTGLPSRRPVKRKRANFHSDPHLGDNGDSIDLKKYFATDDTRYARGGRTEGVKCLKRIRKLGDYENTRDYPALDGTSGLSAHHKFGTVSIRESAAVADAAMGENSAFYGELLWRDFFTHVAHHHPHVFGSEFNHSHAGLSWRKEGEKFDRWCRGETGFPIVDAGMRQLSQTGTMHNRVRMVVASFLTKDLRVDWRLGERYFASRLIDYDPCVNNGNWQWAAGTGCDAQPYFRIFNPWRQQQKFDPQCEYIKRWVPELADCTAKEIHSLENTTFQRRYGYPAPIVNHKEEAALTLKMFKRLRTG